MMRVTFIGFGEAGAAFAREGDVAYDVKAVLPDHAADKQRDFDRVGVTGCGTAAEALDGARVTLSVVTADQALRAAEEGAAHLAPDALWLDCNSVAPDTKRVAAKAVETAGGRYVDVAVMAPVNPAKKAVPLLLSGPHAAAGAEALHAMGFTSVQQAGPNIGDASAIKMIRSVMVKGLEALTTECVIAAYRAGVADAVLASLDASWKMQSWADRADYNLDRMLVHGLRRAAEMEEAAKTLADLGVVPVMTRGTIARQRALGTLDLAPPDGLGAKLAAIEALGKDKPEQYKAKEQA